MDTSVVLLSGGVNSCVAAALARQEFTVAALHVTYGQRTANRDRDCFKAICRQLKIKRRLLVHRERLDAVVITAANFVHCDITCAAAEAGLHVFCEKAMARTTQECW